MARGAVRRQAGPLLAAGLLLLAPAAAGGSRDAPVAAGLDPAVSPDGERIAFVRASGGNLDVWTCALAACEPRRLTSHEARDKSPAFSPDGRLVVFASWREGSGDLWVVPADGSAPPRRVTADGGDEDDPAWSPDGARIAFTWHRGPKTTIGLVAAGGGTPSAFDPFPSGTESEPAWSGDGERLALVTDRFGDLDLAVFRVEDEALDPLSADARVLRVPDSSEMAPAWHPESDWIVHTTDADPRSAGSAFESDRVGPARGGVRVFEPGPRNVWRVSAALPSSRLRVSPRDVDADDPAWTADGTSVVYTVTRVTGRRSRQISPPEIWLRRSVEKRKRRR